MPDAIPIAGLGDDLSILIFVLNKVWGDVDEEIKKKAHDKLSQWFDEEEMKATDNLFKDNAEDIPV